MNKHEHKIIINKNKSYKYKYTYNFGQTKDVSLELSRNAICITVKLGKKYDKTEMLYKECYLFPDALKKAMTLHLILFSENIDIKTMSVQIDKDKDTVIDTKQGHIPPIYSMVNKKLFHKITSEWSKSEIEGYLKLTKSSNDNRLAALNAFIISKSKEFETERFIYLWTAFNGMYNHFAVLVQNISQKEYRQDKKKIEFILKLFDIGKETIDKKEDKKIIGRKTVALVKRLYSNNISYAELQNGKYSELAKQLSDFLLKSDSNVPYNISPYGYLLAQFSYYFRCNIIHGDKPYALFSYAEESEIKCLRCINELLDEFIEKNLHMWFDEAYSEALKDRAAEVI